MGTSRYEKKPKVSVRGFEKEAWSGERAVQTELEKAVLERWKAKGGGIKKGGFVLTVECYPGVRTDDVKKLLAPLSPALWVDADSCAYSGDALDEMMRRELTDDRVFGVYTTHVLADYLIPERVAQERKRIADTRGLVIVCGTGASLIVEGDLLLYCDLARWEIQLRYRAGMPNWNTHNEDAPVLAKYKRGFFIEWRLADKVKKTLLPKIDYVLDTNTENEYRMATGNGVRGALRQTALKPFRVVPYFDPGVWGGQWMKEVCGLDREQENYAWSFDGVPEENSLLLDFGKTVLEIPAVDLVFYCPHQLLGEHVHARFGTEFPIRFDFLDTIGGQNLSLQVHPLTEYIQEKFNMHYTQDESYYILDTEKESSFVCLGVKKDVDREAMARDLRAAQRGEMDFPAEKYVNKIPVKKHDHVLIPAGTVHCSGAGTMVLEISATPYIFTFKLWDWGRLGLDGLPRPIHVEHGLANIQWERDTDWVTENLVGQVETLWEEEGIRIEKTGLHEREFIETERIWMEKAATLRTRDSVNVLNLVEGDEIRVLSRDGSFEPFTVHYAETFMIPAAVEECILEPEKGKRAAVICARVR